MFYIFLFYIYYIYGGHKYLFTIVKLNKFDINTRAEWVYCMKTKKVYRMLPLIIKESYAVTCYAVIICAKIKRDKLNAAPLLLEQGGSVV